MRDFAWGIAATGGIARTVGAAIAAEPGMRVAAVGSRDLGRARALAATLGAESAHGSYEQLCADPAVDAVYVATPHAQHLQVAEAAIAHGKAVLCEKPLAATVEDAATMVRLAREAGVFLMEAMWMRFNPLIRLIAADERFGEIRSVQASFGFALPYDPAHRLWAPELGGGALLDLGIYPFGLAQLLLGRPAGLHVTGSLASNGVDAETAGVLTYPGGRHALVATSLLADYPNDARVVGTGLRAEIPAPFWAPQRIVLSGPGVEREEHVLDPADNGYAGELREVRAAVAEGRTESAIMPLDESLAMMGLLAEARGQLA
ncbi:Gfo/Idh/MocA family oxidoreductase [Actinomadura sp. ATCC 31491]|uniref:Gfo/Idh/MocA family oxidoreductase n=1 Tax=Actinomadura luzonensis TaxID=2805427 RepID=A0ABT0FUQ3_9ACTN|nr:Gfo/Idh/MocA family oxidoreductase [Actinomadura luzonensis]MCK2216072.1 Gfo/Idh/MocA family oxidoreductase [Actinomadura luzonensis]